ncbi:MAG TPA: hypothetical protein VN620_12490, partial [Candidatus Methylomirabilis sp.]|nr:hypothetical protein [Candidatus Methylomirabilis sp.]
CVENDNREEAIVRARDLISEISRYKLRYDRFLDVNSKTRLDQAAEKVACWSCFRLRRLF